MTQPSRSFNPVLGKKSPRSRLAKEDKAAAAAKLHNAPGPDEDLQIINVKTSVIFSELNSSSYESSSQAAVIQIKTKKLS